MAGRGRALPRQPPPPFPAPGRGGPFPPPPSIYEEELELQLADIRRLDADNRRLLEDRLALQREHAAVRDDLRRLDAAASDARAHHSARTAEMIDRGLKLESELRSLEPLRLELAQLRSEAQKVDALRKDQVQALGKEIDKAKAEAKQLGPLKAEAEGLRQELMRVRSAIEFEKKGNAEIMEQRMAMEKNMVAMARDIEKLRAELSTMDARGRASMYEGPYGMKLSTPEGGFSSSYADTYGSRLGVGEKPSLYGAGAGSWGAYDASRTMHR